MKISFDDKSYVEIKKDNDSIVIIISGRDSNDRLKKITNSVSLTEDQFYQLIKSLG